MASDKAEALERVEELEQQLEEGIAKGERAPTLSSGAEASVNAKYMKNILLQFLVAQMREEKPQQRRRYSLRSLLLAFNPTRF
ncbi:hypothetical protein TrLO_g2904 [Triparma laevis f. longispina]|uniref:GRIP domain-containing protein n=1 Tax=Triparma laevis f. longispina TaxID=1714387 RepID=A0A9W7E820_9STRA|nr:hypothetical protein TrLO_g2904 [Triparma laevis f. longispina]